jgi:DNA segregation ATPase FtsK/SpoIIIE-like protein
VSSPLTWAYPALSLLKKPTDVVKTSEQDLRAMAKRIEEALLGYGIYTRVLPQKTTFGPTVTSYAVQLTGKQKMEQDGLGNMHPAVNEVGEPVYEEGKRSTFDKLKAKDKDLAMALETGAIRMAPVLNSSYVGVEIPNKERIPVSLYEIIQSKEFQEMRMRSKLTFALGKNAAGNVRVYDLRRGPHLLIAGTTGSGKSVFLNTLICSILYNATPEEVQFMMIDPKGVEMAAYQGLPHLREAIVTDPELSADLLEHAVKEMKRRFKLFKRVRALHRREVKNIGHYHALQQHLKKQGNNSLENLPFIIVVIDELADLMVTAPKEIETSIFRLAQLARAAGIHLVVATQRPDVTVITGKIKVNIGTRIGFALPSHQDSQTILGVVGAEDLLMYGDMLFKPQDAGNPERIQAPFMDEPEADRIVEHWGKLAAAIPGAPQPPMPSVEEEDEDDEDEDLEQAEQLSLDMEEVLEDETASKATIALSEEEMTRIKEIKWLLEVHGEGLKASISLVRRRLYSNHTTAGKTIDRFVRLGLIGEPDPTTKFRDIYADKVVAILKQYGEEEIDLETGEKVSQSAASEPSQTASAVAEAH